MKETYYSKKNGNVPPEKCDFLKIFIFFFPISGVEVWRKKLEYFFIIRGREIYKNMAVF